MKKNKLIIQEEICRINEISGHSGLSGKHLVVVDVQPEYKDYINFSIREFVNMINNSYDSLSQLTFLYNGYDTLGMVTENEYKEWWVDNGVNEDIVYDGANFYDKGYAFFRYCIDEGIDEDNITNLVKFMMDNNINDTRDLDEDFWNGFIEQYGHDDIRELMEFSSDCINIPDLMDYLSRCYNIVLCGGGINECLKEVEISLNALDKPFILLTQYTY